MKKQHVIIGASAAGLGAMRALIRLSPEAHITCITDEIENPYNTCLLADYCSGIIPEQDLFLLDPSKLDARVTLVRGTRVEALLPASQEVRCTDGREIPYTNVLMATGTSPMIPSIAGLKETKGVFTFHRLSDIQAILTYLTSHKPRTALVIGAGLSGLEAADALRARGLHVRVIEREDQLLAGSIDRQAALFIQDYAHKNGVEIIYGVTVTAIEPDKDGFVRQVVLNTGEYLTAEMVVIAAGVRPNLDLAVKAGITIQDGAIMTTPFMQTSLPAVYAAGDVALVKNSLTGTMIRNTTWPEAMAQGMVAAYAMAGTPRTYGGIVPYVSSSFFGIKFASCGDIWGENGDYRVDTTGNNLLYRRLVLGKGDILRGFTLVGAPLVGVAELKRAVLTGGGYAKYRLNGPN